MFNQEFKKSFLDTFENVKTKETYSRIFKNSMTLETKLNKDLYNFSKAEINTFLKEYLVAKTKQSIRTYVSVISRYVYFANVQGVTDNTGEYVSKNQKYFFKYLNKETQIYLSKSEIDSIILSLVNAQDAFIISALFDGIEGTKVEELTRLKIQDIDVLSRVAKVKSKKGEREVSISKRTVDLALMANGEVEYYKKNGESEHERDTIELVENSPYILKPSNSRPSNEGYVSHYTVYNRLEMIKSLEEFEELKDALTTKNIMRSGMIYEASKIVQENGTLSLDDVKDICKKYNVRYVWSVNDFLNKDVVESIYGTLTKEAV
jgi:integrase